MRVAICDSDELSVTKLEKYIKEIDMVNLIVKFYSVEDLRMHLDKGQQFDVIFMNIDWGCEKNGIDYAAEFTLIDPRMQTIFVTDTDEKFFQYIFLREVNLCGYLEKPIRKELLNGMINNAVRHINRDNVEKLVISYNREVRSIPYKEIIYMESSNRHVTVHTRYEQFVFYGKLDSEYITLPYYFLISHKSYVVNMNYISKIDRKNIYLCTGDKVDISKAHCTEVKVKFQEYMGIKD